MWGKGRALGAGRERRLTSCGRLCGNQTPTLTEFTIRCVFTVVLKNIHMNEVYIICSYAPSLGEVLVLKHGGKSGYVT